MSSGHDVSALTAGLTLGTTYLLSIGPNKMMIIREAVTRGRTGLVASTVLASYLVLLTMSFFLTDRVLTGAPALRIALSWLGVAAMSWFAFKAVQGALSPACRTMNTAECRESPTACLARVLAVAGVNPLMYLELFFLPSAVGSTFATASLRLQFTCGLVIMSAVACYGYAALAHACSPFIRHARTLQAFDLVCGLLLAALASSLGFRLCLQPT